MSEKEIDSVTNVETTGHEWDGIKELNNPLPRWWLYTFYACIVFAIGYAVYYPAIPLIEGATQGISGTTTRGELHQEMAEVEAGRADMLEQIRGMDVGEIQANPELARFAAAGGASAFKVYCSQCHGSGAQGAAGYPNLNDDDWLWGGSIDQIAATIRHGVRYEADGDTRYSEMPAFGRDQLLPARTSWRSPITSARSPAWSTTRGDGRGCPGLRRELRRLSRRAGPRQHRAGGPEPGRCPLAVWQHAAGDRVPGQQSQARRHAGLGRASGRRGGEAARRVCARTGRRRISAATAECQRLMNGDFR